MQYLLQLHKSRLFLYFRYNLLLFVFISCSVFEISFFFPAFAYKFTAGFLETFNIIFHQIYSCVYFRSSYGIFYSIVYIIFFPLPYVFNIISFFLSNIIRRDFSAEYFNSEFFLCFLSESGLNLDF